MKTSIIAASLIVAAFTICNAGDKMILSDGNYTLVLTDLALLRPDNTEGPKAKETIMPVTLKSDNSDIIIQTETPDGTAHTMHGKTIGSEISLWMSGFEGDHVVTYHFTGTIPAGQAPFGKVSVFMGHDRAAAGMWSLQKQK